MDYEYLDFLYQKYKGTALYNLLIEYDNKFNTVFPVNLIDQISAKDLTNAINSNKELTLQTDGNIY